MDIEVKEIVDAAVAKAVAETRDQMRGLFEDATAGLKKNNERLLRQKKAAQTKPKTAVEKYDEWEAGYSARQAATPGQQQGVRHTSSDITADGKVVITKGVSTAEYQRLKKLAADTKAEIVYVQNDSDPAFAQQRRTGVILAHDFKFEGTRYISADRRRELGGPIKAQQEIGEYVTFKSLSDLPEGARAVHDAKESKP